jgi:hypothetical protein
MFRVIGFCMYKPAGQSLWVYLAGHKACEVNTNTTGELDGGWAGPYCFHSNILWIETD